MDGIEGVLGNFQMEMRLRDGDAAMQSCRPKKFQPRGNWTRIPGQASGAPTIENAGRATACDKGTAGLSGTAVTSKL